MNNGRNDRNSSHLRSPVRVHPPQAAGEPDHQEGLLAPAPTVEPSLPWSRTALEDALGQWLSEEAYAQTEAHRLKAQEAMTGMELYRDLWRDSDEQWGAALERMRTTAETRDIVINMLTHACMKMLANQPDDVMEERLQPAFGYVQDMRDRAMQNNNYSCRLMSLEEIRQNVNLEMTAEVLIDLTTDEETEEEVIDLTQDSDEEMED